MNEITPVTNVSAQTEQSVAPTTTTQEDLVTAGQRKINLIWEYTQAAIALIVTVANMVVAVYSAMKPNVPFPVILSSSFFLIVGFYFSRTNHAAIGGIGPKPDTVYVGR